jgi:Xaa-Pro dipeptidase
VVVDERQQRVARAAHSVGAGWSIVTGPDAVAYTCGHEVPYEPGPSPFAGGPTTLLVAPDGICHLVLSNDETLGPDQRAASVTTYEGFSTEHPLHGAAEYPQAVRRVARELGVTGTVAVDSAFPWSLGTFFDDVLAFDDALSRARMVKTVEEIAAIRRAAAVSDAGQQEAVRATRAGRTELEAFADIRCAMETAANARVCVTGEYSSGPRAAAIFDWSRTRVLEDGDTVVCDLAPRVAGYWADGCNTLVVGGRPTAEIVRLLAACRSGIERAGEALRPGITAAAFDREVREAVVAAGGRAYDHHSGHSIGTSVHENPRLVPGDDTVLEAGMVIMVEPGSYIPGVGGTRLEWMFLVTEDGNEVVSNFEHRIA